MDIFKAITTITINKEVLVYLFTIIHLSNKTKRVYDNASIQKMLLKWHCLSHKIITSVCFLFISCSISFIFICFFFYKKEIRTYNHIIYVLENNILFGNYSL